MGKQRENRFVREDAHDRTKRDLERRRRREPGDHFWKWVALIGSVGWPVALLGAGGAMLGHRVDIHWGSGVHMTLILLSVGIAAGTYAGFRALRSGT